MSRIGKAPVAIPNGVTVERVGDEIRVKGPKGTLSERMPDSIDIKIEKAEVVFGRPDDRRDNRALHGLARALVANMVQGVTQPFVKELEIQGVGYRAEADAKTLKLNVGYSHPVDMPIPEGLKVSVDRNVIVRIEGVSAQKVGQFAANVRSVRPPEPYKGKGIRYVGEHVRRKVGKAGAAAAG
ncbi:MAG: 50S ribosomal protein L6 [Deltaproteobacteria bacterium]|nr:50S ribosomal protein L6 [Deltaproteobacteria bacterium]MBW2578168.1 50S ribosomal protein L6 [Deltaproteobacteria bacterium]MBW2693890.1 50S ribosomal protein L6 [Deltaproteobacteria bacterium]